MKTNWMSCGVFLLGCMALVGCGPKPSEPVAKSTEKTETKPTEKAADRAKEHDHSGWWCPEHGVIEAECSMCQASVFKKLKKDEICPKHTDRAKAQCFICNPELWEQSKAVYKAKFGKEPQVPDDNKAEKK